jgi:hypothetical protein
MPPLNLQQALVQVIDDMLAECGFYFGPSAPGYFGLEVSNLSSDGSEFDLTLTLKAGVRYCCVEWGCHLGLYDSEWFRKVKDRLKAKGFASLPPMTVRNLHVLVEKGAITDAPGNANIPRPYDSDWEYDVGPFREAGRADGEPPDA